ncbi:MAG TPA: hypothetical protein VMU18_02755, partial [Rhodoblastus sp.]|nr:hypothetical protein [Rhodoblastus sp.]
MNNLFHGGVFAALVTMAGWCGPSLAQDLGGAPRGGLVIQSGAAHHHVQQGPTRFRATGPVRTRRPPPSKVGPASAPSVNGG